MSGRPHRKQPHARQRKEGDQGEEEGFLYCLMYYFDEARREAEDDDKHNRRFRRCTDDDEEDDASRNKKKNEEQEEEMLNPLVYRDHMPGRTFRGNVVRRAYTPDREPAGGAKNNSADGRRSQSQPPEVNGEEDFPRFRIRRRKR
ncbi:uncharacterized protein LOC125178397 [Hyalella azteca]|uniref:Uncharacterized protein LOC125178397 n=1 Tax=Hyalella azteca TaxID=294128 RepID=A0A979FLT9_HYAAZ|nr:uncharacterized protein LOC125178397 [Hyalella azteca]